MGWGDIQHHMKNKKKINKKKTKKKFFTTIKLTFKVFQ